MTEKINFAWFEVDGQTLEGKLAIIRSITRHLEILNDLHTPAAQFYRSRKLLELEGWAKRLDEEHPNWRATCDQ